MRIPNYRTGERLVAREQTIAAELESSRRTAFQIELRLVERFDALAATRDYQELEAGLAQLLCHAASRAPAAAVDDPFGLYDDLVALPEEILCEIFERQLSEPYESPQ